MRRSKRKRPASSLIASCSPPKGPRNPSPAAASITDAPTTGWAALTTVPVIVPPWPRRISTLAGASFSSTLVVVSVQLGWDAVTR